MRVRPQYGRLLIDYDQIGIRVKSDIISKARLPIKSDRSAFPSINPSNTHNLVYFIAVFFNITS